MRSAEKAREIFDDAFVAAAVADGAGDDGGKKRLVIHSGVDVTDAETLDARLFAGVTQVISCVGSVFGPVGPSVGRCEPNSFDP